MLIHDYLEKYSIIYSDRVAIKDMATSTILTYKELYNECLPKSRHIKEELVFIDSTNMLSMALDMVSCMLAVKPFYLLKPIAPFNVPDNLKKEKEFILNHFKPKNNALAIRISSGSTSSSPKYFYATQEDRISHSLVINKRLEITNEDSIICLCTPIYFGLGDSAFLRSLLAGATFLLSSSYDKDVNFKYLFTEKPSVVFSRSSYLSDFVHSAYAKNNILPNIRVWDAGGSNLNYLDAVMLENNILATGKVIQHCNRADSSDPHMCYLTEPQDKRLRTVGKYSEVKIIDDELLIKKSVVIPSLDNTQKFTGDWYHTEDLAKIDEDGYLIITGRKKLLINLGYASINPIEVEEEVLKYPNINDVACLGLKEDGIEKLILLLVTKNRKKVNETLFNKNLANSLNTSIHSFLYLKELPYLKSGKLDRVLLQNKLDVYFQNN